MRLLRRRCAFLLDLLALILLFSLSVTLVRLVVYRGSPSPRAAAANSRGSSSQSSSYLTSSLPPPAAVRSLSTRQQRGGESGTTAVWKVGGVQVDSDEAVTAENCTMGRCFDTSRCKGEFRVYVYPDTDDQKVSGLYRKILKIIRSSQYYTSNPDEACLFVPSWDTLDRDKLSDEYVMGLPSPRSLSHWNDGRNHLFFNLYSGSWPTYSESLDFDPGLAMIAKASFNTRSFRRNFDISLPLLHNSHPERGVFPSAMTTRGNLLPIKRRYHLAFKGKRYLYGLGVEPRRSLYHIHNGKDVVMVMTCRHNKNWERYKDSRCDKDNTDYNRYDYLDLLTNSTFCLVPRGRRLGSFRFIESLQSSCIPVSLSNGYVLPFDEVIDWPRYSITVDERDLLQVPHITRSLSEQQILNMRERGSWIFETYLSSVEKVVMTTIEIIRNRLRPSGSFVWNHKPGGLTFVPSFSPSLPDYPFYHHGNGSTNYTAVVTCFKPATRGTSPLIRLIKTLSVAPHLSKIIVLWTGVGSPRVSLPPLPVPVNIVSRPSVRINPLSRFHSVPGIETDAVLHLTEDVQLSVDEAEFGREVWLAHQDRMVGYVVHGHYWDSQKLKWVYVPTVTNTFSIILTEVVFFHRYYSHALATSLPQTLARIATTEPDCTNLVLNFYFAHITQKSPIKATHRQTLGSKPTLDTEAEGRQRVVQRQVPCLNMMVRAFGYMPLRHSSVRFDPVLFKDSVSMLRKEYRNLDIMS